jgi:hypothetical protein
MMHGFNLLGATTLVVAALAGCQPEVLIASSEPDTAGTGGSTTAGTSAGGGGTGGAGGTGEVVPSAGEGGAVVVPEPPRLLADSVADWSQTQGERGWSYGYDSGSLDTFTLMTHKSVITDFKPESSDAWLCWTSGTAHWTQIFQLGAHPNGTITSSANNSIFERAVRRWTSTFAGEVTISGEVAKIDVIPGSNGVDASVWVDGKRCYFTFIGGEDGGGRAYQCVATLQLNSTVDFVLDPHESDDRHDLSRFTGIIVRVEQGPAQ